MSVDIFNYTTVTVKISEGSVGVYRLMGLIGPGKKFDLRVHKNSTYREYLLTTESENLPVGSSLTSDDVLEYSRIEIKEIVTPRDPVLIKSPIVKRRGCISRLLGFDQSVTIQIVNCLNEYVKIEEERNAEENIWVDPPQGDPPQGDQPQGVQPQGDQPQGVPPIAVYHIAPSGTFSLSVDPKDTHRYYHLTTNYSTLGWVSVDELKKLSKIEITDTTREYYWQGIPFRSSSGRFHSF